MESFGGKPLYCATMSKKKQLIIDGKLLPIMVGSCDVVQSGIESTIPFKSNTAGLPGRYNSAVWPITCVT